MSTLKKNDFFFIMIMKNISLKDKKDFKMGKNDTQPWGWAKMQKKDIDRMYSLQEKWYSIDNYSCTKYTSRSKMEKTQTYNDSQLCVIEQPHVKMDWIRVNKKEF